MTEVITGLGPAWESVVATTLEGARGLSVARRCADLSELLSVAEAGVGQCAVVTSDLRGLDLGVVARLRSAGLLVVGLHPGEDEGAERRLRQLSITAVLPVDAAADDFVDLIHGGGSRFAGECEGLLDGGAAPAGVSIGPGVADSEPGSGPAGLASHDGPPDALGGSSPDSASSETAPASSAGSMGGGWQPSGSRHLKADPRPEGPPAPRTAKILAVWGPTGSPGRTTIAVNLAAEIAGRGTPVLLIDADTYGGCVAQSLGLLDEAPGIAAACRAADQGTLDLPALARLAPVVHHGMRVLTGLPKAERWPEVRASALERVLELSRGLASVVVVDCGFCLEDDEELSYDTTAPRRNEATLTTLALADTVLAVGGADPVALQRFVRGLQELGSVPSPPPVPVVNRVRASAVGSKPTARIADSLLRFAGLEAVRFVPDDPVVVDAALLAGRSVVEHAPDSALRRAIADLASSVAPWTQSRVRARAGGWRRRPRPAGAVQSGHGAKRMVNPPTV